MSAASASGVTRLPLARGRFRYWLAVAIALVAVASILRRADHRWFRSYSSNPGVRIPDRPVPKSALGGLAAARQGVGVAPAWTARRPGRTRGRAAFRHLRGIVYWLAVAIASVVLAAVVASVGARLFGYSPYVMYGGSMGSAVPMGSVTFIENVGAESLKVGNVIVFRPPSTGKSRQSVMHRIVSIEDVDGQRVVKTKGDANESPDPWQLRLTGEGGRLAFVVPYLGYVLWFFQTRIGWAFVALPLLAYLGFEALRRIWAPAGGRKAARIGTP
jgi:signal peptidase